MLNLLKQKGREMMAFATFTALGVLVFVVYQYGRAEEWYKAQKTK